MSYLQIDLELRNYIRSSSKGAYDFFCNLLTECSYKLSIVELRRSAQYLANKFQLSRASVHRYINILEKLRVIKRKLSHWGGPNIYTIVKRFSDLFAPNNGVCNICDPVAEMRLQLSQNCDTKDQEFLSIERGEEHAPAASMTYQSTPQIFTKNIQDLIRQKLPPLNPETKLVQLNTNPRVKPPQKISGFYPSEKLINPCPNPRYDDVYFEGVAALDSDQETFDRNLFLEKFPSDDSGYKKNVESSPLAVQEEPMAAENPYEKPAPIQDHEIIKANHENFDKKFGKKQIAIDQMYLKYSERKKGVVSVVGFREWIADEFVTKYKDKGSNPWGAKGGTLSALTPIKDFEPEVYLTPEEYEKSKSVSQSAIDMMRKALRMKRKD